MMAANKTNDDWKKILSEEAYHVTREGGTEKPFTGKYTDCEKLGTYICICCGSELFTSDWKYHSGCGWPSFFEANQDNILFLDDKSHGRHRTEVRCKNCDAHLGHIFEDGPAPTGKRYCINSVAIDLKKT